MRKKELFADSHFESKDILEEVGLVLQSESLGRRIRDSGEAELKFISPDSRCEVLYSSRMRAFQGICHPEDRGQLTDPNPVRVAL